MKKFTFVLITILISLNVMKVYAKTEHTVERGETIASIAKHYNVSTDALLNANPIAKEMFYTGMVLVIPEAESSTTDKPVISSVGKDSWTQSERTTVITTSEAKPLAKIDGWFLNYSARFDSFDQGWYGIGFQTFNLNGFGATFSAHGCWGLIDPGQIMFKLGPTYALQLHENMALSGALRGFIFTYDKPKPSGRGTDMKVNGGITFTTSLYVFFDRIFIGVGYELGWCNNLGELYHCADLKFGVNF